jgi:hypothetical protein
MKGVGGRGPVGGGGAQEHSRPLGLRSRRSGCGQLLEGAGNGGVVVLQLGPLEADEQQPLRPGKVAGGGA